MFYVITFPSTYHAISFESFFKDSELDFTLMPVPREISSSCGIAARIKNLEEDQLSEVIQKVKACEIEISAVYYMEQKGRKNIITLLHQNS